VGGCVSLASPALQAAQLTNPRPPPQQPTTTNNNQQPPQPQQEVLDWFEARGLIAYSISAGQSLLYNNVFPKHKERLGKKVGPSC